MAYTVETVNECTKKLVFNFEDVDLTGQIDAALKEKQKSANLKGFRKGKAPMTVIKQFFESEAKSEAFSRFLSQEYSKAITDEKIVPVGYPSFANTQMDESKVSFEAIVETFPAFEVADYSSYSFKKDSDSVSEDDYKKLVDQYLANKATMEVIEDKTVVIENGHFAVINFQGVKEDGERPTSMKGEEHVLEIGAGQFIPGFEEGLIGSKAGDKKNLELTFPEDYHADDLKGAKVTFEVEVLELKERKTPELDDVLAKEFGFESAADFETKNKDNLQKQKTREVNTKLQEEVLKKLIADNSFNVPEALIEQQKEALKKDIMGTLKQQGFDDKMAEAYFSRWGGDLDEKAQFQVRSGLILDKIANDLEVEATEADLDAKIAELAQTDEDKKQLETIYKQNENMKKNIMYSLREEKTFDLLYSKMSITNG